MRRCWCCCGFAMRCPRRAAPRAGHTAHGASNGGGGGRRCGAGAASLGPSAKNMHCVRQRDGRRRRRPSCLRLLSVRPSVRLRVRLVRSSGNIELTHWRNGSSTRKSRLRLRSTLSRPPADKGAQLLAAAAGAGFQQQHWRRRRRRTLAHSFANSDSTSSNNNNTGSASAADQTGALRASRRRRLALHIALGPSGGENATAAVVVVFLVADGWI